MSRFILSRLGSFALTLFAASLLVFATLDLLPGNAAAILLGTAARPDTIAALERQLGLDQPAYIRYLTWIGGAFTGDLGKSASYGVPVGGLIAERLHVTLAARLHGDDDRRGDRRVCSASPPRRVRDGRPIAPRRRSRRSASPFPISGSASCFILLFSTTLHWFSAGGFPGWSDPVGRAQIAAAAGDRAGLAAGRRADPRHALGRARRAERISSAPPGPRA